MRLLLILALSILVGSPICFAAQPKAATSIYIAPDNGFEVSLMAAMQKKHVPVVVSSAAASAQYTLKSTPIAVKTQSTGSKFARCIFADCIGIQDRAAVSVELIDLESKQVVWAYTVHKQRGSAANDQSMAEAIAKHLKKFMEKHPLPEESSSNGKALAVTAKQQGPQ